jgi:hypothetical protein
MTMKSACGLTLSRSQGTERRRTKVHRHLTFQQEKDWGRGIVRTRPIESRMEGRDALKC